VKICDYNQNKASFSLSLILLKHFYLVKIYISNKAQHTWFIFIRYGNKLTHMTKIIYYPLAIISFISVLHWWSAPYQVNKNKVRQQQSDTLQIYLLNEMVDELFHDNENSIDEIMALADSALRLSEEVNYPKGIIRSALNVGRVKKLKREYRSGLNYYLQALRTAETLDDQATLTEVYIETAGFYKEWQVDDKALSFYLKALDKAKKNNFDDKEEAVLRFLAMFFQIKGDYDTSEKYYQELITFYKERNDEGNRISTFEKLTSLYTLSGELNSAIAVSQQVLEIKKEAKDTAAIANYLNKIGILQQKLKNYDLAIQYFNEAIYYHKAQGKESASYAYIMMSKGVVYQTKREFVQALSIFEEVLDIWKEEGNKAEIANALNYLVTFNMGLGEYGKSKNYCEEAIELAKKANDIKNLEKNYKRLSEIYEEIGSSKRALEAYKEYLVYKEAFYEKERTRLEQLTQKQLEAEKAEKELKLQLADQQMKTLELSNLKVEAEKKEQELEMLTQQQELQEAQLQAEQLEKDRVAQALRLAQQKLEAEKREKAINDLKRQQELKDLELKQKELEEQERQNTIALLENEKKLQAQKIAEEAKLKQYGIYIIGLCGFVLVVITFSFIMKQKANKKLKAQQFEIMEKNEELQTQEEELRQNMEELQATQEDLQRNKSELESAYVELETKNIHLTDSIKYAKRIQNAILPPERDLKTAFPEHFVIFIPKDMVSGDFYWFSQQGNKSIIATVDCTGHGVPGAFMSMIGNAHLNQIVNERGIHDPKDILENMHHQVLDALNQKDSRNVDGMDLAIACIEQWEDGMVSLKYSGAKCPLFHYRDGEVKRLDPDRKSIGGWYDGVNTTFTDQVIQLKKGDVVYLTTDGFIDSANEKRRRFGSKRMRELISKHGNKPAYEQKLIFENTLSEHQKNADQRDDITLIGIKI